MSSSESFWEETESNLNEKRNDNLMLVPKRLEDIELEVEQAKEQLDYLEILRARQHKKLIDTYDEYIKFCDSSLYPEYENMLNRIGDASINVSSELGGKFLRIKLDFLLPIYHKTKNTKMAYYVALQDVYQKRLILKLITHRKELPNFTSSDKVFVLIVQYFNNNMISDLDNRFHSFIFNALRSAKITPDDRWQKLAYMEDGRKTLRQPHTEIFVGDYREFSSIIHLSNKGK